MNPKKAARRLRRLADLIELPTKREEPKLKIFFSIYPKIHEIVSFWEITEGGQLDITIPPVSEGHWLIRCERV